jgi:tRNA(Arg) A34 adenosine deaminase TadA
VTVTEADLGFLRRCVDLAREALEEGDEPFGSLLVDRAGRMLFADRNRTRDGDQTRHPEFEIARWAGRHIEPAARRDCTVYTSGEHCPMCSAALAWAGLGRIVYAVSSEQLTRWRRDWGLPPSPVPPLPITALAPGVRVSGPAPALVDEVRELHRRAANRHADSPFSPEAPRPGASGESDARTPQRVTGCCSSVTQSAWSGDSARR